MRSTFKLLFYINRQKVKKNGKCPVMGRITLDGKVSQYSTGLEVEMPCPHWKPKPMPPTRRMWTVTASCRLKSSRTP